MNTVLRYRIKALDRATSQEILLKRHQISNVDISFVCVGGGGSGACTCICVFVCVRAEHVCLCAAAYSPVYRHVES